MIKIKRIIDSINNGFKIFRKEKEEKKKVHTGKKKV
tara:strand:- start:879 stop:986 length:108 start_codon:yes stop_codon:yes gene_type:complete